jgi:serine/threonine-protein kinase
MPETNRLTAALSDRYAIEREIGSGGMATVYLARDLKHDRDVALKVLRADLSAVLGSGRFLKEISITARLDHPHILTLIDSGEANGILYYVLPLVRGESLRAKLEREKQLPIEESLSIIRQVASALDYAHKQGVVHRDIKPENILLHEGEAVVADFGIALALREAGGSRLTETGLSLGTPQYMSPEQATGDRTLDARSDIYSLGAVLYEMLAGEPPVTGPTVQAVIAKLLTERPTRLRTVRDTVPDPIDAAVAKALAKVPADRFASAAEFAAALKTRGSAAALPAPARLSPAAWLAIAGVVVLAALGAWVVKAKLGASRGPAVSLTSRTQLTFSGNVLAPGVSPDGKQLAFFTRKCAEARCSYAIDVQDVGSTVTRRVLDGATAVYGMDWSPDRRNLIAIATIGGRWGRYLISGQAGAPRFLTSGAAAFYAGGDSLLIGPPMHTDSAFWIRVTSLGGAVADSIRVTGTGAGLAEILAVPGAPWIAADVLQGPRVLWQVFDRKGRVADRVVNTSPYAAASADALWMVHPEAAGAFTVTRQAFSPGSGHVAMRGDTVFAGLLTDMSVTADGSAVVYDAGTYDYGVWALDLADALRGRFPDARRLVRSSSMVRAVMSPDGRRVLVERTAAAANGGKELRLSVLTADGGAETPLSVTGTLVGMMWLDSATAAVSSQTPEGQHVALLDVRTGAQRQALAVPDSIILDWAPVRDGWAWIPAAGDRIVVEQGGRRHEIPKPAWFATLFNINADAAGDRLAFTGWNLATFDTLGVDVVGTDGRGDTPWARIFAENGAGRFNADGTLDLIVFATQDAASVYRVASPGKLERLGTVPRPVIEARLSSDLRRIAVVTREYNADAWMAKVEKRP